jgi:hypothetical protein
MAKLTGGLHGRVAGMIGGIVYSSARSRQGKVNTAREFVMPKKITDSKVLKQRIIFSCTLYAVRYLGAGLWANDFNRGIGQLPGFHSMMSIILKNTDRDTRVLSEPPDTPLGSLYAPTVTFATHGATPGSITVSWPGSLGPNGTAADVLNFFGIEADGTADGVRGAVDWTTSAVRSDLTVDIPTGSSTTTFIAGVYFQGAGVASGILSRCQYHEVDSL